jgi:hypothetical protein
MPGHSIAATAAMPGASDSNPRQVTTTVNAARAADAALAFTPSHALGDIGCEIRLNEWRGWIPLRGP